MSHDDAALAGRVKTGGGLNGRIRGIASIAGAIQAGISDVPKYAGETTVTPETLAEGVTAHDAAGNLITGTMKMGITSTKVWENASPTSLFAGQTITLDLSEYDAVYIKWATHRDYTQNVNPIDLVQVGTEKTCMAIVGADLISNNTKYNLCARSVTVNTDAITFTNGLYNNAYNGGSNTLGSNESKYMIPLAIYGIKGVFPA